MSTPTRVLVVDDDGPFVDALVAALSRKGLVAKGCKKPWEVVKLSRRADFSFDLILLDMRLGDLAHGDVLNAAKVLPHLKTYSPSSKVVVFTQQEITVEECVQCIRLGALGIIPKGASVDDFVLIADVYRQLGDENESKQEVIRALWQVVCDTKEQLKGRYLEMLMINLFNSMPTFRVLERNKMTNAGEIDIIIENTNQHQFWRALDSVQLIIECKNKSDSAQLTVLNQLKDLVLTRGKLSTVGILVSMSSVTKGFRKRSDEIREHKGIHVFFLGKNDLETLVDSRFDQREAYLREVFSKQ